MPTNARPGGQPQKAASAQRFLEKAVILEAEDFPSLRATFSSVPRQREALKQKQELKEEERGHTHTQCSVLKISDFGFARYLMPQGLADRFCGSLLYMAPEIIQDRKYDAKADLWSVGTILFQLPFLNIMASHELHFPEDVSLHPDCTHICRRLLRRNPVERLSFEESFNHNFLATLRTIDTPSESKNPLDDGADDAGPSLLSDVSNSKIASMEKSFTCLNSIRVFDSLEFIEQDHFASMETCTPFLQPSLNENSTSIEGVSNRLEDTFVLFMGDIFQAIESIFHEAFSSSADLLRVGDALCDPITTLTTEAHFLNQQCHQKDDISQNILEELDFTNPLQVFSWAERGFLIAYDRVEKLSSIVQHLDGEAEMPNAMEIIFQMVLTVGKNGVVEEPMGQFSKTVNNRQSLTFAKEMS
ncbi:serine/threonine-protein kinase PLK4-like [Zingiber officinale]|uniref:serine/threonine-protein kinase PLK4-like n=1 Tax=Zingiber officinale TaxID=94328 RepID=UPI001C4A9BCB|nr:serine/threonine-protein kinase PLK4-like [Zingiber officinale]